MKILIGSLLIIIGVVAGVWIGVWWGFVGGIVDVIEAVRATELVAMAVGVAKVMFAGLIGFVSFVLFAMPGLALMEDD